MVSIWKVYGKYTIFSLKFTIFITNIQFFPQFFPNFHREGVRVRPEAVAAFRGLAMQGAPGALPRAPHGAVGGHETSMRKRLVNMRKM